MRTIEPEKDEMFDGPIESSNGKKERPKTYPRLRLKHESFPETKKWEVGKEYTVEMKIKMVGLSISRFSNDSEFEIRGFGTKGKGKTEDDNQE